MSMISLAFIVSKEKEKILRGDRKEKLERKRCRIRKKDITSLGSRADPTNRGGVQVLGDTSFTVIFFFPVFVGS